MRTPIHNLISCWIRVCSLLLLVIFSQVASAHPGKTDHQDGHKCLKNCSDWDLYYAEYHLHDKDRNPVRVERRKKPLREPVPAKKSIQEPSVQEVAATQIPSAPESQTEERRRTANIDQGYSVPVEEGCMLTFYESVLLGVVVLLMLVMIYLRRKKESE